MKKKSDKMYSYKKRTSPHVCPILVLYLKYQYCIATFFQDHALLKALPNLTDTRDLFYTYYSKSCISKLYIPRVKT